MLKADAEESPAAAFAGLPTGQHTALVGELLQPQLEDAGARRALLRPQYRQQQQRPATGAPGRRRHPLGCPLHSGALNLLARDVSLSLPPSSPSASRVPEKLIPLGTLLPCRLLENSAARCLGR